MKTSAFFLNHGAHYTLMIIAYKKADERENLIRSGES